MIRKSGWLVFLVLVAFVLALVYLFAGAGIRYGMIYSMEKAAGAEVNIEKVSLGLFPLSIEVDGLQVTDKHQPTHNVISFENAQGGLEVWPALLGYYVVDELSVDGLAMNQERDSEGEVYVTFDEDGNQEIDLEAMLQVDLPSSNDLIARANLQTEAKGEALQQLASEQKQQLEDAVEALPDRARLEEIQKDIESLIESDIENAADLASKAEQLKTLKDELESERDKLKAVQNQLKESRAALTNSVAELREASQSDWNTLQDLANINEGGLAPISEILLGDIWGERIAQLEGFYALVAPYLPEDVAGMVLGNGEGAEVEEALDIPNRLLPLPNQPYPDFWVKSASINWLIGGGEANLNMQDITSQHAIIDTVTQFALDVSGLPQLSEFNLDGDFSIFEDMVTNMSWDMAGLALSELDIGSGEDAFQLASALLASSGSLELINTEISQQADVLLQDAIFGETGNQIISQLLDLLNEQTQIPFSLGATGEIRKPDISVRSDLDSLIGDALLGGAKEKIQELQNDLRADLDTKLQEQLGVESEWLSLLDKQDGEASSIEGQIQEMLSAELGSLQDEVKDRLKDSLFRALGG